MNDSREYRIRLPQPWSVASSRVCDPLRSDAWITTQEFQRTFQRPSGLTPDSHIEIEVDTQQIDSAPQQLACLLNGRALESRSLGPSTLRFWVRQDWLQSTNQATVRFVWPGEYTTTEWPQVALILK